MIDFIWIPISAKRIIYHVEHRVMEGGCQAEHGPVAIDVPAFEMTKYPITNGMYLRFMRDSGYRPFHEELWRGVENQADDRFLDFPAVNVNVCDALAYCNFYGYQLPSETQWQRAAGGSDDKTWPWGNEYKPGRANDTSGELTPVDAFPLGQTDDGIMDMCGNAWEWTRSILDDGIHKFALLRGGSCYRASHFWHMEGGSVPVHAHVKFPLLAGSLDCADTITFRCVRERS
jgi:formylglycine-generating enzyme required for sulfatase activity